MTRFWWLNPWAEVHRLRAQLRSERDHYAERQAGFMRRADSQKRQIEKLQKRVAELEKWEPPPSMPRYLMKARRKNP